jgi:ribosomal protein S18 acetylase RimI-like enzyme
VVCYSHRNEALNLEIRPLAQEQGSRLAEIIARAFHEYPAFRQYIHADLDGDDYKKALRATFEYFVDLTYAADDPVIGAWIDNQLVGGMLVRTPNSTDGGEDADSLNERFARSSDTETNARLEAFEATMHENEPQVGGGRYYIDTVAVDPGIQSSGFGREMIEHVIKLSHDDPESVAVCLCTEAPENHGFYKHLGFEIVSSREIGPITTTSFLIRTPVSV